MKLETKVGAFFVGAVAITGFLILRMEKLEIFGKSNQGNEFVAEFDQVAGLNPNSPVRVAGVKVG
jgi:phospholipid/cholesterol/gamma-HCH transport system substrate-binding protein